MFRIFHEFSWVFHEFICFDKWGPEGKHLDPLWQKRKKKKKKLSQYNMLMIIYRQLFLSLLGQILCWGKKVVIDPKKITPVNINWKSSVRISNSSFFPFLFPNIYFQDKLQDMLPLSCQSTKILYKSCFLPVAYDWAVHQNPTATFWFQPKDWFSTAVFLRENSWSYHHHFA